MTDISGLVERLRESQLTKTLPDCGDWAIFGEAADQLSAMQDRVDQADKDRNESARQWRKFGDDMQQRAMVAEARVVELEAALKRIILKDTRENWPVNATSPQSVEQGPCAEIASNALNA